MLAAIAPAAGLGRVTGAVPHVAAALGYDVDAALMTRMIFDGARGARSCLARV